MIEVGIDLVDVGEVRRSVEAFGDRYLHRVYTDEELAYSESLGDQRFARLASRFAAKEAVMKVLRPVDEPIPWKAIEIRRDAGGATDVELRGVALEIARRKGIERISISLTHHGELAAAVAAAECRGTSCDAPR